MRRLICPEFVGLVAIALLAGGCGTSTTTDTTTTTTPAVTVTEAFNGTLTLNGAQTYSFTATAGGTVTVTLTSVTPDTTAILGLALGTWNGTSCQIVISNDNAIQGSNVTGTATAAGNFCVRVYDAAGTLPNPETFSVSIVHY